MDYNDSEVQLINFPTSLVWIGCFWSVNDKEYKDSKPPGVY